LPFPAWKSGLARHMESCPACARRLAGKEDVRRVLVQAGDLGGLEGIWPAVRRGIRPQSEAERSSGRSDSQAALMIRASRPARAVRWAAALSGLAVAAVVLVGTVRYLGHPGASAGGDSMSETNGFVLHSARIDNKPARTYIIHPQDDGMVVVWVEKSH
jgi:hypothetical protein